MSFRQLTAFLSYILHTYYMRNIQTTCQAKKKKMENIELMSKQQQEINFGEQIHSICSSKEGKYKK